ncbi:MAG TPA: protein kinase [Thermoleophilaceae bacterium]|nr:protein kinase [Thermoleophilaceae bacterium]
MIGTLLNERFRLEEKIGSGGMSTVYRAFDETLERWVAIKLMHREISSDSDQLERFRREARAVASLNHPHVVTVIDFGEDDDHPYIVFEYVEGENLKDRLRRAGRLPVPEAVAYAIEIGRALECAHSNKLVHRDVKPQNVLIDPEGRAKVTDFGIARSLEAEGLTATGRVLGTTDYVAPEQALGEVTTAQSDVYSLGICLFEMLTGEVPFKADSQVAVAMKHVKDPLPDIRMRRPEISAALAAVVERACAKETANRYQSAHEVVADLEQALVIEASRSGEAEGEATTVLRSLPEDTAEFGALRRLRHPRQALLVTILGGLLVAAALVFIVVRAERGSTGGADISGEPALTAVKLETGGADDFDPDGDDTEHPEEVRLAIDGNVATRWETETYTVGDLQKEGVGLIIRPRAPVAGTALDVITPIPGWSAEVYASDDRPDELVDWGDRIGSAAEVGEEQRIELDAAGQEFGYYLLWITALPEGEQKAAVSEMSLKS